jgi:membrane protein
MPSEVKEKTTEPGLRSPGLWKLGGAGLFELSRKVANEIRRNRSFGRASELAFDFLFALFPLILFVLTLFGLFASRRQELQQDFLGYFAEFLPASAFQLLHSVTAELAASAGKGKLTLGILLALWFGSGGVSSAISALNAAYRVREERSWLRIRAVAVALTLALSILLLVALFLSLASGRFLDWFGAELGLRPYAIALWAAAQWPASILFVLISYSLIYFFAPDLEERKWHWLTPGSAFGAVVWLAASEGFRIYLKFFDTYGASYGSLGAVMILLAWLYLTALSFLIGGTINAEIERGATSRDS